MLAVTPGWTLHRREADAFEFTFGDDWLVATLLRTLAAWMEQAGRAAPRAAPGTLPRLRREQPPGRCHACLRTFVEDPTKGTRVSLVCLLPCSHWMCTECWQEWRAACPRGSICPSCNQECAGAQKDYVGVMV